MAKREFLMLAHRYEEHKSNVSGAFISHKLDGERCYWDGGITRGMKKSQVPWANVAKDSRYINEEISTGLWSRYSNVIHASNSWLDSLPLVPLDGELWCGVGYRQDLMKIIKRLVPNEVEWQRVTYQVFDCPSYGAIFEDGLIDTINFKKKFSGIVDWIKKQNYPLTYTPSPTTQFITTYDLLQKYLVGSQYAKVLNQERLPMQSSLAEKIIQARLKQVTDAGGEGLVIRNPFSTWKPERSHDLLKVKSVDDAEGVITGFITGAETDKGSKLLGKIGAMILRLENGKRLELSGFSDIERKLVTDDGDSEPAIAWAIEHPKTECPTWIEGKSFKRGMVISFQYRGLTKAGIPSEARYWRERV